MDAAYDRYIIHRGDRTFLVMRPRPPITRIFDDDDSDSDDEYHAPYILDTRVPIILDHDLRDLSAPDAVAGGHEPPRASKRTRVAEDTEAAIRGLPEVTPGANAKLLQAECAVCLKDFDADHKLRAMPCAHAFHEECIFRWLRHNGVCPLCRHPLPHPPPTQDKDDDETALPPAAHSACTT